MSCSMVKNEFKSLKSAITMILLHSIICFIGFLLMFYCFYNIKESYFHIHIRSKESCTLSKNPHFAWIVWQHCSICWCKSKNALICLKCKGVKSRDIGSHGIQLPRLIHFPENALFRCFLTSGVKCRGSPFYMN